MTQAAEQKDFFISYTSKDSTWAEWIAFELEAAGYSTIIQAWDIRPGSNVVVEMDDAAKQPERTLLVLSAAYQTSEYTRIEWAAALRGDPSGKKKRVLPVRIEECDVEGLLGPIVYIDLVKQDEQQARERLLAGVKRERAKPIHVAFPAISSTMSGKLPPLERPVFPGSLPPIWNVPYPRNMLFTGREELLAQLATSLRTGHPTAISQPPKDSQPQAISGLGGIGKTQIALEYAYRSRGEYQAVLWAQADTKDTLTSSYLELATLLNLPEKDAQESAQVITAIKKWLQRSTSYVLILDNADDLVLAREFLPPSRSGHILLTTRAQATGRFARRVEADVLPIEQGVEFLLRRAGLLSVDATLEQAPEQDKRVAQEICEELGRLPLALDQAGAYIEETGCGLSTYARRYQHQRSKLLAQRRGMLVLDHPLPVATTWKLSFEQVEQRSPAGADLLRVCAFVAPDAIPETIFTQGASHLGPHLAVLETDDTVLDEAREALLAYSLVKRDATSETLSVHRLVQAVLKDQMNEEEQREWAERVVQAVNHSFPEIETTIWSRNELLLSHAKICAALIQEYKFTFPEATQLLTKSGYYLMVRAQYREAEPLLRQALEIHERVLGATHSYTAFSLGLLGQLYQEQGKYREAEMLLRQALEIHERVLGATHSYTIQSLSNLGYFYGKRGRYKEAEPLLRQALVICEQVLGNTHSDTATALHRLGLIYSAHGKYKEAEPLLQEAMKVDRQVRGSNHPDTIADRLDLGWVYIKQTKYEKAEPLFQEALTGREQTLGPVHPEVASSCDSLGWLYWCQGKYEEAEPLFDRAVKVRNEGQGLTHPDTAKSLLYLGLVYDAQGKLKEAEQLCQRSMEIYKQVSGQASLDIGRSLGVYAYLLLKRRKIVQAAQMGIRALRVLGWRETLRYTTETVRLYVKRAIKN